MMKKGNILMALLLIFVLAITGCTTQAPEASPSETAEDGQEAVVEESLTYEGQLDFNGLKEFSVAYDDIYKMTAVTREVKHVSSSGEESVNQVTGVLLSEILTANDVDQKTLGNVRFTAGDGYAIDVPQEIVQAKDIILAWNFDGEQLDEKKMPLRVAINDERSMYYVSNLAQVTLASASEGGAEESTEGGMKLVLMETAITGLESAPFMYYDAEDQVVNAADLVSAYVTILPESVAFMANDGYEKTESFDVVNDGFIKFTGEDAPLFTGQDLPKGMNVKFIMTMGIGDANFVSVNSSKEALTLETVDGDEGVNLKELVKLTDLKADTYVIKASDGYEKVVSNDDLKIAIAYVNNSNTVTIKFNDEDPKKSKIKNALTIEAGTGPAVEEDTDAAASPDWFVTVDGLSDGSFDFDKSRAERKLTLVDLHTERMKNDVVKPEDWQGYKVVDILEFLKVEDYNSLVFTAGDGYEVEIMKDQIDDETILAVVKDGEPMTDADNLVQLVQNTEFATTWVKGVAKITVK